MKLDFDRWLLSAVEFLRIRRHAPNDPDYTRAEHEVGILAKRFQSTLRLLASDDSVSSFQYQAQLGQRSRYDSPFELLEPMLRGLYSPDEVQAMKENWDPEMGMQIDADGVYEARVFQGLSREVIRHLKLLPEQRAILKYIDAQENGEEPEVDPIIQDWFTLPNPQDPKGLEKLVVQDIKLQWGLEWWNDVNDKPANVHQFDDWWAALQQRKREPRPGVYPHAKEYMKEIALLRYHSCETGPLKFLWGVIYATALAKEDSVIQLETVQEDLGGLAKEISLFSKHIIPIRPGTRVGYLRTDPLGRYLFKPTNDHEVQMYEAIKNVTQSPAATEIRLAAHYPAFNGRGELVSPEDLARFAYEVRTHPDLGHHFELPVAKPWSVVLDLGPNKKIIALEHEGETLTEVLARCTDKERQCKRALAMLRRFHRVMSENLITVQGATYASDPRKPVRDQPSIPTLDYHQLIQRRVKGLDNERLGNGENYEALQPYISKIAKFLDIACHGVIVQDADDPNITLGGLIDFEKVALGNFMYDVARFLYGPTWTVKEGVDRVKLRDGYIKGLKEAVLDTDFFLSPGLTNLNPRKLAVLYSTWRTRHELIAELQPIWEVSTKMAAPGYHNDAAIEALYSQTLHMLSLGWSCLRPRAQQYMVQACQAAAILATMGEVGAMSYRRSQLTPGTRDYSLLSTELEIAVQNSHAFMQGQGFSEMAKVWFDYLKDSDKIPNAYLVEKPERVVTTFVEDLHERIDRTLQENEEPRQKIDLEVSELLFEYMSRVS